jgi:queuine tRNA-ribosyltransferase
MNMGNLAHARDERPIQDDCDCYCCANFSRAYLRHLVKAKELLAHYLLSVHNIRFLIRLVADMRNAILDDTLDEYVDNFLSRYLPAAT